MSASIGSVRQWHWISAGICAVGMLFFSWTGITLNHAGDIPASPEIITIEDTLPNALLKNFTEQQTTMRLPIAIRSWLKDKHKLSISAQLKGELDNGEYYLAMPRPGADAWLSIDIASGEFIYERTDRGWIAFFNDLHKGRDSSTAWIWFIDIFAVGCIIFCLSGLWLLYRQAAFRLSTWPITTLGILVPLIIILTTLH